MSPLAGRIGLTKVCRRCVRQVAQPLSRRHYCARCKNHRKSRQKGANA